MYNLWQRIDMACFDVLGCKRSSPQKAHPPTSYRGPRGADGSRTVRASENLLGGKIKLDLSLKTTTLKTVTHILGCVSCRIEMWLALSFEIAGRRVSISDLVKKHLNRLMNRSIRCYNVSSGLDLFEHSYSLTRVRFRELQHCPLLKP